MMGCHDIKKLVSRSVDIDLEPDHSARVDHHLDSCADCRAFLADMTALAHALEPADPLQRPDFVARVTERIEQPAPVWFATWYRPLATCVGVLFFACGVVLGSAMLEKLSLIHI